MPWLPDLRDSIAFKVAHAYGLRRRELTMLESVGFGPNLHVAVSHAAGGLGKQLDCWERSRHARQRSNTDQQISFRNR
jgi:hypothetical protein